MGFFKKASLAVGPGAVLSKEGLLRKQTGGFKDLLFGKEGGAQAADPIAADILALKRKGIQALTKEFETPVEQQARAQAAREGRGIQQAGLDRRRQIQQQIAQRGLGASSIGLGQQAAIDRDIAQQQTQLTASLPERIAQLRQGRASRALAATSGAPIRFQARPAVRRGGLAPLIGAGVGGALGGPSGAQIGLGVGQASQGAFG